MRGHSIGSLDRDYLHSPVTAALYGAVTEIESHLVANLLHGVMHAAIYGNPMTDIQDGNKAVREMFKAAMRTMPYVKFSDERTSDGVDRLVDEWRRVNDELVKQKEADSVRG